MLRLSDLLGADVVDEAGANLGCVRDVRVVQDGPLLPNLSAAFRVTGLIVGHNSIAARLGFDRSAARAPWLVRHLALWISRDTRFVPWSRVASYQPDGVRISGTGDDLGPVPPVDQPLGGA